MLGWRGEQSWSSGSEFRWHTGSWATSLLTFLQIHWVMLCASVASCVKCVCFHVRMFSELFQERKCLDKLVMFQQGVIGSGAVPVHLLTVFSFFTFCFVSRFLPFCHCWRNETNKPACRKRHKYQRSSQTLVTVSFPLSLLLCLLFCCLICCVGTGGQWKEFYLSEMN